MAEETEIDTHDSSDTASSGDNRAAARSPAEENLTSRNWDGWPTPPTPDYLVPQMGKIPVSSTAHFQTVAMTSMGAGVDADGLWLKLRAPMLTALRNGPGNAQGRLVVTEAVFGDSTPSVMADVTAQVAAMVTGATLSVRPSNELFEETVPGLPQSLIVMYRVEDLPDVQLGGSAMAGELLELPEALRITRATYGDIAGEQTMDVTAVLQEQVRGNTLTVEVMNSTFGRDPRPNLKKQLVVEYEIGGRAARHVVDEATVLTLPLGLEVNAAQYGFGGHGMHVTKTVAERIEGNRLHIEASTAVLGTDPAPNRPKQLRVDYTIDGVPGSVTVRENEVVELAAPDRYTPDGVYKTFFDPPPASLAELADRLVNGGLRPQDFAPDDAFATMREVLEGMAGIARRDRLDPLEHADAGDMDMPAEGVILYHEQGWYGRGLALGNLLHSVALAPGEVTQVAMTNWTHRTRASDSESVSQTDSQAESSMQDRAVAEIQASSLHEHAAGDSSAQSDSLSTGFGSSSVEAKANWLPFVGVKGSMTGTSSSVGTSHTVSTAVTHSSGDKNLSMGSNQTVNALTQRHAEAARTRRATVVREVAQSEDETLTTRVVANYNHMHALTVMYFEVIEVFSLKTRVVDAERLIFLPFKVRQVRELVPRYRAVLVDAANAAGRYELAEAIGHYKDGASEIVVLNDRIKEVEAEIKTAQSILAGHNAALDATATDFESEREPWQKKLDALRDDREVVLKAYAGYKDVPSFMGQVIRQALQAQLKPFDEQAAKVRAKLAALDAAERRRHWELTAERDAAARSIVRLERRLKHFKEARRLLENLGKAEASGPFHDHELYFNQAVWLRLSSGEVLSLARRLSEFKGETLYDSIDPTPVAITGNYVGYRWRIRDPQASQRFKRQFVEPFVGDPEKELATVSSDIAVPTGGVFGEAVLGNAVSAEKIDLSRFWNWKDSMIPILPTGINALNAATPTTQDLSAEPGRLDESSAKLSPLQDLPAPSGFGALAQTMQAQVFRDMTGQAMLQTLAEATTKAAASSEANAAQIASKNLQAGLNFMADMAAKALAVAAAPETGGGSLLGSMVGAKSGGGASLLGGVLNAEGAGGGELLGKMTGSSKGNLAGALKDSLLGEIADPGRGGGASSSSGATGGGGSTGSGGSTSSGGSGAADKKGGQNGGGSGTDGKSGGTDAGDDLPANEGEPKPPVPGGN